MRGRSAAIAARSRSLSHAEGNTRARRAAVGARLHHAALHGHPRDLLVGQLAAPAVIRLELLEVLDEDADKEVDNEESA